LHWWHGGETATSQTFRCLVWFDSNLASPLCLIWFKYSIDSNDSFIVEIMSKWIWLSYLPWSQSSLLSTLEISDDWRQTRCFQGLLRIPLLVLCSIYFIFFFALFYLCTLFIYIYTDHTRLPTQTRPRKLIGQVGLIGCGVAHIGHLARSANMCQAAHTGLRDFSGNMRHVVHTSDNIYR